jgi:hypothetical protein
MKSKKLSCILDFFCITYFKLWASMLHRKPLLAFQREPGALHNPCIRIYNRIRIS